MKIESLKDLGEVVRQARKDAGLKSQAKAAEKLDITQPALSYIETGSTNVSVKTLIAIARAFGKRIYISIK